MNNNDKFIVYQKLLLLFIFSMVSILESNAQVIKPFKQRVSNSVHVDETYRNKKIYNLRGDFKMIGNTNMRKSGTDITSGDGANNSGQMDLVNIDPTRSNSSSAYLNLGDECSKVVYAGLYWTGRSDTSSDFTQGSLTQIYNNGTVEGISMNIESVSTTLGSNTFTYPRYEFVQEGKVILQIDFISRRSSNEYFNESIQYRYGNSGSFTTANMFTSSTTSSPAFSSVTNNGNIRRLADIYEQIVINIDNNKYIAIDNIFKNRFSNADTDFLENSTNYISYRVYSRNALPTTNPKLNVKLKHNTESSYHNIVADDYFVGGAMQSDIFTAYADVTDKIKSKGSGTYTVADIALNSGYQEGGAGLFGGWGMVIIYENAGMKWRDITIFDGYGYVQNLHGTSSNNSSRQDTFFELAVEGFHAAQHGDVNVTMGMMAGEGDRGISGDKFQILNSDESAWVPLSHTENLVDNFFNSSINLDGSQRNPFLVNNLGIDIVKFDLDNVNEDIIDNNQTKTKFRYGSKQDTYVIHNIVFAVDAYVPEAHAVNLPKKITKANPAPGELPLNTESAIAGYMNKLQPGDIVEMEMEISNYGNERIRRSRIDIVLPESMKIFDTPTVVNTVGNVHIKPIPNPLPPQPQPDPADPNYPIDSRQTLNDNNFPNAVWKADLNSSASSNYQYGGVLQWNLGTIPAQELPNNVTQKVALSKLTYKLIVTDDCELLKYSNETCKVKPIIKGDVWGLGEFSSSKMKPKFIIGYEEDCSSTPIYGDAEFNVSPSINFLTNFCNANDIEKDVLLEFACADVSSDNIVSINKNLILYKNGIESPNNLRYPVGTLFYTVSPITVGFQSSLVDFSIVNSFVANLSQDGDDLVDYLYVVLPINQIDEEYYNCYYTVTIKVSSLNEVPVISNPIIDVCLGNSYAYDAQLSNEGVNKGLSLLYFSSVNSTIPSLVKPMPTHQGVHNFWVAQGILNPDGTTWCFSDKVPFSITIKGCSMKVNPQIYNNFKRP